MPTGSRQVELGMDELRAIAGWAAACAGRVLAIFEREMPADPRPRDAIDAALEFAGGERRTAALRRRAMAAHRAARDASAPAAAEVARAAGAAAAAAYLHPLADADQVKHILGAAAHAAMAAELDCGVDRRGGVASRGWALEHAPAVVVAVLARYPAAPPGGGRAGELMRELDAALRQRRGDDPARAG